MSLGGWTIQKIITQAQEYSNIVAQDIKLIIIFKK